MSDPSIRKTIAYTIAFSAIQEGYKEIDKEIINESN